MDRTGSQSAKWRLETDTRTDEERKRDRSEWKKDRRAALASALTMGCLKANTATMDSNIQEKLDGSRPRCGLNAAFVWEVSGLEPPKDLGEFDIKRLFEGAASGDVTKLAGLEAYLRRMAKGLSDSSYQRDGKTVLMKALMNMKEEKSAMVDYLLDVSEKTGDIQDLVNAAYTDIYYKGQTALHIAIERRRIGYVRKLVESGSDVHAKACGKFFQQRDERRSFYFGELPLSLAACTNQPELVDFLLDNEYQAADVTQTDSHGNTVLHALVAVADNTPENTEFITRMYDHILTVTARRKPDVKLEEAQNKQGRTPLKMAAKTGKIGLLAHILRREISDEDTRHLSRKFTEWVYGPIHTSLYDLESLDTYGDKMSALEIIVYGSDIPNRPQMLEVEPLSGLLEDKWNRFAGRLFLFHILVYLVYLAVFTTVAFKKMDHKPPFPVEHSSDGYLYISGQLLITLASCYFVIRGILDLARKRPKLHTLLIDGYYDVLFCAQGVFFLVCAALYVAGDVEYLGLLVLSLLLGWVNLLYFFRGHKHMGVYSVLIQKVLVDEILPFLFVYMVFLFGFSAAIVALLMDPVSTSVTNTNTSKGRTFFTKPDASEAEGCQQVSYHSISFTMLELFKFAIGIGQVEFAKSYGKSSYDNVIFYILLIIYIILGFVLLLNMLIALMSKTVERTTEESTRIWRLQRAIATLDLERFLPACLKSRLRCGVDVKLGSKEGNEDNRRCFRVEEVDWNVWNSNVGISREEPVDWNASQDKRSHGFFKDRSYTLRRAKPKQLRKQQHIENEIV